MSLQQVSYSSDFEIAGTMSRVEWQHGQETHALLAAYTATE